MLDKTRLETAADEAVATMERVGLLQVLALVEIRETIADRLGDLIELEKKRNGAFNAAIESVDVEVSGLGDRLEANEQAVQSCFSTMGEMQKVIQELAENQTQ